jgi:tetratricopeptide (TPR) repeat protein
MGVAEEMKDGSGRGEDSMEKRKFVRLQMRGIHLLLGLALLNLLVSGCAAKAAKDPTSRNPHVVAAGTLKQQGNIQGALAALDQAIEKDPRDAVAWNDRASIYLQKGLYDRAIADYSRALSIQEHGLFYANRGFAKVQKGLSREAIADLNKAIDLGYEPWVAYLWRGRAYYDLERHEEAIADLTRSLEQNPTQLSTYGGRGTALFHVKRYSEAISDFDRYLPSRPEDILAVALQGAALLKTGNPDRARANVRNLIELDPRLAVNFSGDHALDVYDLDKRRTMVNQAVAAAQKAESHGELQEAFRQYEIARTWGMGYTAQDRANADMIWQSILRLYAKLHEKPAFPEEARRFGVQATNLAEQKRYDEAIALYQRAFGIAPWWAEGHFNRALLLAERSRYQEAIAEMKQFVALVPNAPEIRAAQDKIYEWELQAK